MRDNIYTLLQFTGSMYSGTRRNALVVAIRAMVLPGILKNRVQQ